MAEGLTTVVPDDAASWDRRYAAETYAYGLEPNRFLVRQRDRLAPGMDALVPGDGEGRNGVWLAAQGLRVVTVDFSAAGVAKARALAERLGVPLDARHADLAIWDWLRASFDIAVAMYLHLPPALRRTVHRAMLGALRPGGLVVLEAFRPGQRAFQHGGPSGRGSGGPADEALLYSADLLRADFAGAETLVLEEVETDLAEGTYHHGHAAVVRAVLRRPAG